MALSLLTLALLAQPQWTAVTRVDAGAVVPVGTVEGPAMAVFEGSAGVVAWSDQRRTEGFVPEVGGMPSRPRGDLWSVTVVPLPDASVRVVEERSRHLCAARNGELLQEPALGAWRYDAVLTWRRSVNSTTYGTGVLVLSADGGVSGDCVSELFPGQTGLGPPVTAMSAAGALVAAADPASAQWRSVDLLTGGPGFTQGALPLSGSSTPGLSLVAAADGGFHLGLVRPGLAAGTEVRSLNGSTATSFAQLPDSQALALVTTAGQTFAERADTGALYVRLLPGGGDVASSLAKPFAPGALLALATGGLLHSLVPGGNPRSWTRYSGSVTSSPTSLGSFAPDAPTSTLPRALVELQGARVAATTSSGGAWVFPSTGANLSAAVPVALQPAPQQEPSLGALPNGEWLVGWRESGPSSAGRLARLSTSGAVLSLHPAGSSSSSFVAVSSAPSGSPLMTLSSSGTGVSVSSLSADFASAFTVATLTAADSLRAGGLGWLAWTRRTSGQFSYAYLRNGVVQSGTRPSVSTGRCAAVANNNLWLPYWETNTTLKLLRVDDDDITTTGEETLVVPGPSLSTGDATPSRPCVATWADVLAIVWAEPGGLRVQFYDVVSRSSVRTLFVPTPRSPLFPVAAALADGWVFAWEAPLEQPPTVQAVFVRPDFAVSQLVDLGERRGSRPLESRGPRLASSTSGSAALAFTFFDEAEARVALGVRVLSVPMGGWGTGSFWTTDGGTGADGGLSVDAGAAVDAGLLVDGGTALDAGAAEDAGTAIDAGATSDAGTVADGGPSADAGATTDGGADAGVTRDGGMDRDAGTAGDGGAGIDAGATADGGGAGGNGEPVTFSSCGCGALDPATSALWAALLLAIRRARRPRRGQGAPRPTPPTR